MGFPPFVLPPRACLASGMEYDKALTPNNDCDYPYATLKTFYTMLRDSGYHVLGCGKKWILIKAQIGGAG